MKLKVTIKIIVFFIFICLFFNVVVEANEQEFFEEFSKNEFINNKLNELNLEDLEKEISQISEYKENVLIDIDIKKLIYGLMNGDINLNYKKMMKNLMYFLGQEITINLQLLAQVIILAVISAVFRTFHESFSSKTISQTAELIVFLILSLILLQSFQTAMEIAANTIDIIVSFMQALLPVLLALLISMGAITSAAFFKPFTYVLMSFFSTLIKTTVLPMIFVSCILYVVDNINDQINISKFAKFFREIAYIIIALILISFIGILVLRGGTAAIADSLTLRTAKYLTGTFVPVIGGFFADAAGLIVSCSLIIKNALNIFGVIIVIFIAINPVLKIAVLIIIYKIAILIVQPIAGNRLLNILENIKDNLISIFVVLLTATFIFFVCIAVIAGTANLTVMMR